MKTSHYIAIVVAIALIFTMLKWGNTVPPAGSQAVGMQRPSSSPAETNAPSPAPIQAVSFDSVAAQALHQLPKLQADSAEKLQQTVATTRDSLPISQLFLRLAGIYDRNNSAQVHAWYLAQSAIFENSEKNLTFAGRLLLGLMENDTAASLQLADAKEAVVCLEQALKINPDDEETKLSLATGYIEGTGEPMRGVQILLAITGEKPDDIPANMLLGRMSVQSGQFEKAVGRFETVLKQQPENKEALYFIAQAYDGMGDKKKAAEYLEKCKKLVNDPEFSREIDEKLNSLK